MITELEIIGRISTPYKRIEDCPRNVEKSGPDCHINLGDKYIGGIQGLRAGDEILILYWFENTDRSAVVQTNCGGTKMTGTFSLRSPDRPNPIAVAERTIEQIENGVITVQGMDCLDNTKLLDIKPTVKRK